MADGIRGARLVLLIAGTVILLGVVFLSVAPGYHNRQLEALFAGTIVENPCKDDESADRYYPVV